MTIRPLLAALALTCCATSTAQSFDPRAHRVFAGKPGEVLVLGTPHISGLPETIKPADFAPLLDRLAAWKPDLITTESVSGVQCEELRRYAALHPDAASNYCWDPAPAQRATGLDVAAATLGADKLLSAWPATPTASQRRRLAALFLAGGERASALVQWLRLPPAERRAGDGLDDTLVSLLNKLRERRNEDYLIAAPLAARLGHERVYPADDHSADNRSGEAPGYEDAIRRAWSGPATEARRKAHDAAVATGAKPGGVLPMYRIFNDPAEARGAFDGDFGAALRDDTAQHFGRQYVAWWETRNLRMIANIRAAMALRPAARVLSLVGSSHKGYFEAYLGMMHDVTLADAQAVLR